MNNLLMMNMNNDEMNNELKMNKCISKIFHRNSRYLNFKNNMFKVMTNVLAKEGRVLIFFQRR